jgi:hypothetical protein
VQLISDDLFAFGRGLCHMRAYRDGEAVVALAVELDDNPGASIANDAEQLSERSATVFGGKQRVFLHFPGTGTTWTEVIFPEPGARADFHREMPHAEIEALVGAIVVVAADAMSSAHEIGGTRHPLLALIPPKQPERHLLAEMEAVQVADLPWPHNPSRCAHIERFNEVRQLYDAGPDGHIPAGAHFFVSLIDSDFAACRYHQRDWRAIAAASVTLLDQLPHDADTSEILTAASTLLPSGADLNDLTYLFTDPIAWAPGETSIINGQHRTCALKASGAAECVVVLCGERRYLPTSVDPLQAGQATLAAYWVDQLRRT